MEVNTKKINENIPKYMKIDFNFMMIDYNFKIVKTSSSESFGGNEIIVLNADDVYIKITKDREQYSFYFTNKLNKKKEDWYDWDIIRHYLEKKNNYELPSIEESFATLYNTEKQLEKAKIELKIIESKFKNILACLQSSSFNETQKELKKYKSQRAKLRYG